MKPRTLARLTVLLALTVGLPGLGAPRSNGAPTLNPAGAAFTCALYRKLAAKAKGDAVFSPVGAKLCLGMALEGARGDTRREILAAFGAKDEAEVRAACLPLTKRDAAFSSTNRATAQTGYPLHGAFTEALEKHWRADFRRAHLGDAARLDLENLTTFQGRWKQAFDKARPMPFRTLAGETKNIPMLHAADTWGLHAAADGYEALYLPYKEEAYGLLVVLPDTVDGLPKWEADLTPDRLERLVDGLAPVGAVEVFLPKLDLRADAMNLAPALAALGVRKAFDQKQADFSGAGPVAQLDGLRLGAATQTASLTLDEQGTKARAETHFVMIGCAAAPPRRLHPDLVFRADHPFAFFVLEGKSGEIVFAGRKGE